MKILKLRTKNSAQQKRSKLTIAYNPFSSEIEFYSGNYDLTPFSDNDPFPSTLKDTSPWLFRSVRSFGRDNFINGRGSNIGFTVDLQNRIVSTPSSTKRLGSGFNHVAGSNVGDKIRGNRGNNILFAFGGDDVIEGSAGNDKISGGAGYDTLNYSRLGTSITLGQFGLITKGYGKGVDAMQGDPSNPLTATIERIIGAENQVNSIDATGASSAIEVDLAIGYMNVEGIAGGGNSGDFDIENFVNVTGGLGDDTIIGNDRANVITGSAGNDKISGGAGYDTLDYSRLGVAITLGQFGLITKGSGKGVDAMQGDPSNPLTATIERIVGASNQANSIDVSGAPSDIEVNLARGYMNIASITGGGNKGDFDLENFVNVTGGFGDDTIVGNNRANTLVTGAVSSDSVSDNDRVNGGAGGDRIVGGSGLDSFSGGYGRDIFVLGSSNEYYYRDNSFMGTGEFATLNDFRRGFDKIVLNGDASNYVFLGAGRRKTRILRDVDSSGGMSLGDDTIAFVPTGFSNSDIQFV